MYIYSMLFEENVKLMNAFYSGKYQETGLLCNLENSERNLNIFIQNSGKILEFEKI